METRVQDVHDNGLTIHIELNEELDIEDVLLYVAVGDLFSVDVSVSPDEVVLGGDKHDVWAWLAFNIFDEVRGEG